MIRSCYLLLLAFTITPATAQIVDPGFEVADTWLSTCPGAGGYSSDVPIFGGSQSASIGMLSSTLPPCFINNGIEPMLYQELPGLQNGDTVQLHCWTKVLPDVPANLPWMMGKFVFGWMTSPTTYAYDLENIWASASLAVSDEWGMAGAQCVLSGIPFGATPAILLGGHAVNNTNGIILFDNVQIHVAGSGAKLSPKVWLDGCYVQALNLMRDDLRTAGLIPATEPYTALYGGSGGETVTPAVLAITGNNAIVDWVHLELRIGHPAYPAVAVRNALLQRDGDIVDVDGISPVSFDVARGNYWVVVRHRNHLGAMSAASLSLTSAPTVFDLRNAVTECLVRPAPNADIPRKTVGGTRTLWPGDAETDGYWRVKYTGIGNDRDEVLWVIGGLPNSTVSGYHRADVNLDGVVKYTGPNNDRDPILLTVGSGTPNAVRIQQAP